MKLLFLRNEWEESYLPQFQRLTSLVGHQIVQTTSPQINTATVAAACVKHKVDAVICSQQKFLECALQDLPDYIPPPTRKQVSLDDYAGSLIRLRNTYDLLIINPIDRLFSVPHEKFVLDRYVSKLTKPEKWWPQTKFQWQRVTQENVEQVKSRIAASKLVAIDIETPENQHGRYESISCVSYTAWFPATNTTESYILNFSEDWEYETIQYLNDLPVAKVFQNGSFDNTHFLRWNCPVRNWLHDTQHLFHSWLAELPKRLDFITSFALRNIRYWKDDGKTGSLEDLHRYCCLDSWATLNAYLALLRERPVWAHNNYLQEFPLVFPGITAACEGLDVDLEAFKKNAIAAEKEKEETRKRISYLLGVPDFNPNSPPQMMNLFTLLGVGYLGSTDKAAMLKAKAAHPLNNFTLDICTDYREASKLFGTYLKEEKLWYGRLYYAFNPAGTVSGRLDSTASSFGCGFQIQNVPRGISVKEYIIAPPGWYIAEADKAQAEARCVGYLSGETKLIDLVEGPHDYHAWNAQAFFGVPYEQIYDEQNKKTLDSDLRDLSKRTNHGANYNMGPAVMLDTMGPKKVARAKRVLKLPAHLSLLKVCEYLLDQYAKTYPGIKKDYYAWITETIELTGMLVSPFGWTRRFFGKPSKDKRALNVAVAHPSQNLSVAIINREWYKIWSCTIYGSYHLEGREHTCDLRNKVRIKAQIHDSLLFIYRDLEAIRIAHQMMNTGVQVTDVHGITRTMVIPTDLSTGKKSMMVTRWSELK